MTRHHRLLLAPIAALALAGCSFGGPGAVDQAEVEEQVSSQLEQTVGTAPDDVTCPDDLPAEEGAEMTCELTAGEDTLDVDVTVTSVDGGDVAFDIQVADEVN